MRTVGAPTPKRVGNVVHTACRPTRSSGRRAARSSLRGRSTRSDARPSRTRCGWPPSGSPLPLGPDGRRRLYAFRDVAVSATCRRGLDARPSGEGWAASAPGRSDRRSAPVPASSRSVRGAPYAAIARRTETARRTHEGGGRDAVLGSLVSASRFRVAAFEPCGVADHLDDELARHRLEA
jgi:hypothetical protein